MILQFSQKLAWRASISLGKEADSPSSFSVGNGWAEGRYHNTYSRATCPLFPLLCPKRPSHMLLHCTVSHFGTCPGTLLTTPAKLSWFDTDNQNTPHIQGIHQQPNLLHTRSSELPSTGHTSLLQKPPKVRITQGLSYRCAHSHLLSGVSTHSLTWSENI